MKINISDARRQLCGSACCRWALLKLDLCSITAILHPRLSSHPPLAVKQRERRRDDFIYTRRKPAASPRRRCRGDSAQERNGTERAKGKRRGKETKEKRESRTKGGGRIPSRADASGYVARSISNFISRGREGSPLARYASRGVRARFIPAERQQPGLFRSSLSLKLAEEITATRHDFIRDEKGTADRGGGEDGGRVGGSCDATASLKYHGKQGPP